MPKHQTERIKRRVTKAKLKIAIKGSGGIMLTISKRLGVEWHTAKKYISKYQDLKKLVLLEEELLLDAAEMGLYADLMEKKEWAIKYMLDRKGKRRGFTTGIDVTSKDEKIGNGVVIIMPDNNRVSDAGN